MPDYSQVGSQRDAITRALMNIAMPPPATQMPQGGATASPQAPGVQGPMIPPAGGAQPGMPQAPMGPTQQPGAMGGMGGGVQGPPGAGGLPQGMPPQPGLGQAGLPQGPVPKTPQLVGQPLAAQQPGSVMPQQQPRY